MSVWKLVPIKRYANMRLTFSNIRNEDSSWQVMVYHTQMPQHADLLKLTGDLVFERTTIMRRDNQMSAHTDNSMDPRFTVFPET